MANEKKYLDMTALSYYDEKLKAWVAAADAADLAVAKKYADDLGVNYDAAGTAKTKMEELANGAVKANTEAIAKLNGDGEGSVAKAIADAKALIDADIDDVEGKADAAQAAADKAQEEVDAVETDMGDVDALSTTNKTVVGAINEVLAAVGTGGTAAVVTVTTDTTTDGALKSYTIKQGNATVGVIDIPKDMVVESGEVVTNPEGHAEGTYIKLVLANVAEPLYINVGTLVDIYKAKANATQVQVAIDAATREISAAIVAGSIGTAEIADNAIVTAKIADANVTKAKLSSAVQASLDKADAAATKAEFDEEVARAKKAEEDNLKAAKDYADQKVGAEKERAEGIEAGLESRLAAVEAELGEGEGTVAAQIAAAKQAAIDTAAGDATAKDAEILSQAKTHANNLNSAMDQRVGALETASETHALKSDVNALTGRVTTAEGEIDTLQSEMDAVEAKAAANETAIGTINTELAKKATQVDLNAAVARIGANETAIAANTAAINSFKAITNAEIDTLFN